MIFKMPPGQPRRRFRVARLSATILHSMRRRPPGRFERAKSFSLPRAPNTPHGYVAPAPEPAMPRAPNAHATYHAAFKIISILMLAILRQRRWRYCLPMIAVAASILIRCALSPSPTRCPRQEVPAHSATAGLCHDGRSASPDNEPARRLCWLS